MYTASVGGGGGGVRVSIRKGACPCQVCGEEVMMQHQWGEEAMMQRQWGEEAMSMPGQWGREGREGGSNV